MNTCRRLTAFLAATSLFLALQRGFVPAAGAGVSSGHPRVYLVRRGHVRAFDGVTLRPISPSRHDILLSLLSRPGVTQMVPSEDGSKVGVVTTAPGSARTTVSVVDVRRNVIVRTASADRLTLMGVSDDGRTWYGERIVGTGRVVQFVRTDGRTRNTLTFRLAQACCVLLQYDPGRDRLYALPLGTAWGRNPHPPTLSVWQVLRRRMIAAMRTPGDLLAGTWIDLPSPSGSQLPPTVHREIPGFALSPDGRVLVILDYVDSRLDMVDALRLRMIRNPLIHRFVAERTTGPISSADAALSGTEDGFDVGTRYSPNGRTLYQSGTGRELLKNNLSVSKSLVTYAIDARRQSVSGAVTSLLVAPLALDPRGTWAYTVVVKGKWVALQRRDPATLAVRAQRLLLLRGASFQLLVIAG